MNWQICLILILVVFVTKLFEACKGRLFVKNNLEICGFEQKYDSLSNMLFSSAVDCSASVYHDKVNAVKAAVSKALNENAY